jgi:type II secretory pathway component PulC
MKRTGWPALLTSLATASGPAIACNRSPEPPAHSLTAPAPASLERSTLRGLSKSARIVPQMRGDRLLGLRVYSVDPRGPLARMGLQNGDLVTAINGAPLVAMDGLLPMYEKLKSASHFEVRFERDGQPMMGSLTLQ